MDRPTTDESDLVQLVRKAQARDTPAFTELVLRFQNLAMGFAYSRLRDWHQAQDAAQDALIAAYEALPSLQEPAAFAGWLRSIVFHRCQRMLRRYEIDSGPIDLAHDQLDPRGSPADAVIDVEQRDALSAAILSLDAEHREAVAMFYLRGVSQKEMSAFLGVPISTVNNRLHESRALLKKRMMTMATKDIEAHRLDKGFAENIGRIVSVKGQVVEAKFDAGAAADVFDILATVDAAGGRVERVKVAQRLADGTARGVAVASLADVAVGASIANVGGFAEGVAPLATQLKGDEDVAAAVRALGRPADHPLTLRETGIKAIDLFCPLPADGNVGLFGIQGVGRIVLVEELFHRLAGKADGLRLFYLVHRNEPDSVRGMLRQEDGYPGDVAGAMQVLWLLSDRATDMDAAAQIDPFDAAIYCHPLLALRGLWPAIDPLLSDSVLLRENIASAEHRETATRARELISKSRDLMADPKLLAMLACRAQRQARRRITEHTPSRLAELSSGDRLSVARARKLENFLTCPFFVAEKFTTKPGKFVPLAETIRGVKMILDGQLDEVEEAKLAFIGGIDVAK